MLEAIRRSAESWGVKILFGLIILVFVFWGVGSYQGNKTQVVAYVNERPILEKDFLQALDQEMENVRRRNPTATMEDLQSLQLKPQVLSQMINDELLLEEAARLHVSASADEIAEVVRSYEVFYNEQGDFDPQRYRLLLSRQGMTPAQFEQSLRLQIMLGKLREYASLPAEVDEREARDIFDYSSEMRTIDYLLVDAGEFSASSTPTEEQIEDYYGQHVKEYMLPERMRVNYFAFTPESLAGKVAVSDSEIQAFYNANASSYVDEEQVKARHILFMVPDGASEEEDAKVRARAEDVIRQVKEGASFATLAKELSEDLTKDEGGDLGWVSRGEMVDTFEEALFTTAPGELSEPVRTPFGWHVILVEERKDAQQKPLEAVRQEIRDELALAKAADTVTDLLDRALEQIIGGVSMEEIASSLDISLHKSELLSKRELKAELRLEDKALDDLFAMQDGEVTDTPLAMDTGYLLAEAVERKPAELQPLKDVREQVVEAVTRSLALDKAKERAEELAASLVKDGLPPDMEKDMLLSEAFGRQGFIQGLGLQPELANAAFAAPKGTWLDKPFPLADGYVLARVASIVPPTEEQWLQSKDQLLDMMRQGRKNELFGAYLTNLRKQASVEIVNPRLLE